MLSNREVMELCGSNCDGEVTAQLEAREENKLVYDEDAAESLKCSPLSPFFTYGVQCPKSAVPVCKVTPG